MDVDDLRSPGMSGLAGRVPRHLERKLAAVESFAAFLRGEEMPAWPLEVTLEVSNVCDLKCAMCPRFSALNPDRLALIGAEARGFMDMDAVRQVAAELAPTALVVNVFGYGEATLHPHFDEILALLEEYEVLVEFFTNAMHLGDGLAERLVARGVHRVTVSLSGSTREDYEDVYLGGRFDRLLDGLGQLRDAKHAASSRFPLVEVNSLSFRHHLRSLDRFVELMAEVGVDRVNVTPLLEHEGSLPELRGHGVTVDEAWARRSLARARSQAAARGVELRLHPSLLPSSRRRQVLDRVRARRLPWKPRPAVPVGSLRAAARRVEVRAAVPPEGVLRVLDPRRDSFDEARVALDVRPVTGRAPLVCMLPFTGFYLRRNGQVKPCCFMRDDAPSLGSLGAVTGTEIWRGNGFRAMRHAFLNGESPELACGLCLSQGQAPWNHELGERVAQYARWHEERFGPGLLARVEEIATELARLPDGRSVAARLDELDAPIRIEPELLERGRRLVRALSGLRRLEGAHRRLVDGWVGPAEDSRLIGWVWSPVYPELRLPVALWVGDCRMAETVAAGLRPDVRDAGFGDGRYGFGFELEPSWLEPGAGRLRVCLGDTTCELACC